MDWITSALEPIAKRFEPAVFSRLVSALSLCVGAEALIVLRDVRGLSLDAAADVASWAARAILRNALAETLDG